MRRILVAVVFGTVLAGAGWQNVTSYFARPSFSSSRVAPDSAWQRGDVHRNLALMTSRVVKPRNTAGPSVYPYSVVPGGVKDLGELRAAAARDSVVGRHYANFDFDHARLVRASAAREVYLSYRIRNTVFWTRKTVRLHAGEPLLTDGKITARAHCGNQISDTAKPEVAAEEPREDILDQPVASLDFPSWPMRPGLASAELAIGAPTGPQLFGGGFGFPLVPFGVPLGGHCPANEVDVDGHCHPKHRQPVVPEPTTAVLAASGLALILSRYRRAA